MELLLELLLPCEGPAAPVAAIVPVMSVLGADPESDGGSSRFVGRFSGGSTQAVEALLLSRDGRSGLRLPAPQAGRSQLRSSPLWTAMRGQQMPSTQRKVDP